MVLAAAFRGDFVYDALLWLHIVCAIVGFGGVMFNALYGAQAKARPGPGGLAISEANLKVSDIAEWFIYAVFITGLLIVVVSNDPFELLIEPWVASSIILYVIGIGVSHAIVQPSAKRMVVLQQELVAAGPPPADAPPGPPPQAVEMEGLGKRLATFGPVLHVILAIILVMMVFQPGT
jgi:hypothetical protein